MWLNAESRLTYPVTFGTSERRVRLEGEAYFEVEPGERAFRGGNWRYECAGARDGF